MSPSSRLRLSIDNDLHDAAQLYARAHHHNNPTTYDKVFFDSQGRPHDPEFVSHIFPTTTAADRRRAKKARRLSQTGLIQDSDSDEEDLSDTDYQNMATDPFRSYTANARRAAQSTYYYSPPGQSTSTSALQIAKTSNYPATPAAYSQYQQQRNRYAHTTPTSSASSSPPSWQHTASLLNEASPVSEKWSPRRWARSLSQDESAASPSSAYSEQQRRVLKKNRPTLAELVEDDDDEQEHQQDPDECVPTCSEALRRQWQSFTMSFKLTLFRGRRRISSRRRKTQNAISEKFGFT